MQQEKALAILKSGKNAFLTGSAGTGKTYVLNQYISYLKEFYEIEDIKEASHQQIRSWIVSLIENGISPRSVNRKISTLQSFYKFLRRMEFMDINPIDRVISPKTKKRFN